MSNSPSSAAGDFSRSETMDGADSTSPSRTLTDLHRPLDNDEKKAAALNGASDAPAASLPVGSTLGGELEAKGVVTPKVNVLAALPARRKNILLFCFCLSMFIDAAGVSATFLMTAPIASDLGVSVGNEAWILGTYSLAFASTLLFAGRLADLYPPHLLYNIGFVGLAVFYLIISFMTDQYAFFVLRAVSALLAVWTIPSSINMIIQMYPDPADQAKKLALFGMSGALANTIALVLAGVFLLASWRWYFRFICFLIVPTVPLTWWLMPKTEAVASDLPGAEKWKRMDLGGVFLLMAILVLFILAFTQATVDGWNSAIFIAPLIVSIALLPVFVYWEYRQPEGYSLLPHGIWQYPNIFPLILQASAIFMWFATYQLRSATYFQDVIGDSAILSAVKLLPMGITALFVGGASQAVPSLIVRPHYVQPIASALCFAGSMLLAYSNGGHGNDYWKFIFTGEIIGTAGGMLIFIGMNTCIIQSFPLEYAGVGGAFANVIFQIGGVIGIGIQSGLTSTGDGTLADWEGSKNGYFFTSAYIMVTGLLFLALYRQSKMPQHAQQGIAAAV